MEQILAKSKFILLTILIIFCQIRDLQSQSYLNKYPSDVFSQADNLDQQFEFDSIRRLEGDLLFCCLSSEELEKCQAFAEAVNADHAESDLHFGSYHHNIKCKQYQDSDTCMKAIDMNDEYGPNIMATDAGDIFVGGRYHSLVPILREIYGNGQDFHYSVAVVKRGSMPGVQRASDLRGAHACFSRVGSLVSWTIPVYSLIKNDVMEIKDCNNHVKSAIDFFGTSCAVNSLQDRYNPLGDNDNNFCELCGSDTPGVRCTNRDPYAGELGAVRCLKEKGDVAFLNEKSIVQSGENPEDYELLCPAPDGSDFLTRRSLNDYKDCAWGIAPSNAIVVSSAMDMEKREAVQLFLQKAVERYGNPYNRNDDANFQTRNESSRFPDDPRRPQQNFDDPRKDRFGNRNRQFGFGSSSFDRNNPFITTTSTTTTIVPELGDISNNNLEYEDDEDMKKKLPFRLFESTPRYGILNDLLFSDETKQFRAIKADEMSYRNYLKRGYGGSTETPMEAIQGVRRCRVGDMKLCVTSEPELAKCVRMRTALNAQLLEPKMSCKKARSHIDCMRQIHHGEADVVMMDAGDIYRAGWQYGLIPVMAEVYNLGSPHYYAVAVAKQRDNSSELIYLKRKNTCHTAVGHAAGWVIPMAWLIGNERVRDYGCDSVRAAAEYFSKSCAPGAENREFAADPLNSNPWEYSQLCHLCHGNAGHYCRRNHMEDYYGYTGAFRCLVEGGGNVAFVKHTTVTENCDGKRKEWWARNQLTSDYELLCRDGTRAPARDYKRCYLGKVKSNALVTSPRFSRQKIDAFINLFKYAQQFYGQKVPDEFSFSMYYSEPPYADLIFQDATQQLIVLPEEEWDYTKYLDKEFLKAYSLVECRSSAFKLQVSSVGILVSILSTLWN